MCQQMVSGVSFDTGNCIVASELAALCTKPLFYGPVETYFAVYDSVVLTGPITENLLIIGRLSLVYQKTFVL